MVENTQTTNGELSAYALTHKHEFEGLMVPFGARVFFKPGGTRPADVPGKWEPDAIEGVFAGWEIAPGMIWAKRYKIWAVSDFDGLKLRKNIRAEEFPLREPFRVSRLVVPAGDWQFSLKSKYEFINSKAEGDADRAEVD